MSKLSKLSIFRSKSKMLEKCVTEGSTGREGCIHSTAKLLQKFHGADGQEDNDSFILFTNIKDIDSKTILK